MDEHTDRSIEGNTNTGRRHTDVRAERHMDREMGRQTDGQTEKCLVKWKDRQMERGTDEQI
jgi:hypothetical protein